MIDNAPASPVAEGLDQMARHSRTVLIVIAGLQLGGAALLYAAGGVNEIEPLVPQIITGVVFALLAVWARKAPMVPVTIGVIVYAVSVASTLLINPGAALSMWGLILHAILIVLCINGISSARSYNDLKRRFGDGSTPAA